LSESELLLDKAAEAFDAAELQLENDYVEFAASRAYYGSFYVAEALLLTEGLRLSRHGQVVAQYGRLFAKSTRLDPAFHRLLDRGFSFRQSADYVADAEIDPDAAAELIREGRRFLKAARGYLEPPSPEHEDKRREGEVPRAAASEQSPPEGSEPEGS
jgi:uncharacterized protein (UPF0332 family)